MLTSICSRSSSSRSRSRALPMGPHPSLTPSRKRDRGRAAPRVPWAPGARTGAQDRCRCSRARVTATYSSRRSSSTAAGVRACTIGISPSTRPGSSTASHSRPLAACMDASVTPSTAGACPSSDRWVSSAEKSVSVASGRAACMSSASWAIAVSDSHRSLFPPGEIFPPGDDPPGDDPPVTPRMGGLPAPPCPPGPPSGGTTAGPHAGLHAPRPPPGGSISRTWGGAGMGGSVLGTGGDRGIGLAIARRFAADGDSVTVTSRSGDPVDGLAVVRCDVRDAASVDAAFSAVEADQGPVEVLVANAGVTRDTLLALMGEDAFAEVLDTNLAGAYRVAKRAVRGMMRMRRGRLIFISSVVGLYGSAGQANYASSKAGLVGLARSLARELGSRGITSNVIAPGFVDSDMTANLSEERKAAILGAVPLGRYAAAAEVAAAVAFLAGPDAGYITGAVIPVDGGLGMGH